MTRHPPPIPSNTAKSLKDLHLHSSISKSHILRLLQSLEPSLLTPHGFQARSHSSVSGKLTSFASLLSSAVDNVDVGLGEFVFVPETGWEWNPGRKEKRKREEDEKEKEKENDNNKKTKIENPVVNDNNNDNVERLPPPKPEDLMLLLNTIIPMPEAAPTLKDENFARLARFQNLVKEVAESFEFEDADKEEEEEEGEAKT